MAGFGMQPLGTTPYGLGTPATAPVPGGALLRDTTTGKSLGGRLIDQRTGDYVQDANGRLLGMRNVPQLFQLAITTDVGSSAVRDLGNRLRQLDRITDNFAARVLATVTDAAQSLINRQLVQVLGFSTFKAGPRDGLQSGQTYGRIRFRDLTTGQEHDQVI